VELAVGIVIALIFVAFRSLLVPLLGDRAPYAFNFLAVVCAAVLAGWRSGLVALAIGQAGTWFAIVQPQWAGVAAVSGRLGGFLISTTAEFLTLCVIILYQREVDKASIERERRVELLDEALREIDHRTRNNYQTVLAMIELQARRTADEGVSGALLQVASQQLAAHSANLGVVRLDDHLCGLVRQIERGLSRNEVNVECDVDVVTASAEKATWISIIVNELVTNALKHAFNGEQAGRVWVSGKVGRGLELVIADDGRGVRPPAGTGTMALGTGWSKALRSS
jgi:two-component sensor histidine kinase